MDNKQFRFDLSFLRAFSVLVVLFYHYNFFLFSGGFVGVDVFFVISGYLMTSIILSGIQSNTFNLITFYKKRIIRIIPALLFMLIFFLIILYFFIPTQFIIYLKSAYSSCLFFSNFIFYLNSGYFDYYSQFNFLLHTWSLSVEWQLYMVYPLLLLLLKKIYLRNIEIFKIIYIFLIALSFLLMNIYSRSNPSYAFYMFYLRAWEMMFGGLAFIYSYNLIKINNNIKKYIFIISLVILFGFVLIANRTLTWPSYLTLVPVFAVSIIIFINVDIKLFHNKIITYLGNISYSLYLWHWPIYVLSAYFSLNINILNRIFLILVSLLFAIISYHFIEKTKFIKVKFVLFISIVFSLFTIILTEIDIRTIYPTRYKSNLVYYATNYPSSTQCKAQYSYNNHHFQPKKQNFLDFYLNKVEVDTSKKNVILLGDSHAGMFIKTFKNIFKNSDYNLIQITTNGAYPMIYPNPGKEQEKFFFNYFFKEFFPKNSNHIDLVIISSSYIYYAVSNEDLLEKIDNTESYFKQFNVKTLFLGQNMIYDIDFPTKYYLKNCYSITRKQDETLKENVLKINALLKDKLNDKYLDLLKLPIKEVSNVGIPYVHDTGHFTFYGAEQYAPYIKNKLIECGVSLK
ncbi:acyltransferase [Apibacter muscae]|uniref:acyltransferase family protein n=1 Tax=Apibacter muscae TaxID=2509004 RepID=UPI0011AC6B14|nr:acyltransferase family protein [Apibacter muscae]TWP29224.1 acyltransferase [Apibacter muscae]